MHRGYCKLRGQAVRVKAVSHADVDLHLPCCHNMASGFMPNLQVYKVHGFIPSFPIKVDEFVSGSRLTTVPTLHLLSYTHSVQTTSSVYQQSRSHQQ